MTAIATMAVPLAELDKVEKITPQLRLIAVTHGDPTDVVECGRPITYRAKREGETLTVPDLVPVCALHGDVLEVKGNGFTGLFAYRGVDMRPRRKAE